MQKLRTANWVADHMGESRIKKLGLDYTVETIKASEIDLEASLENKARLGPIDDKHWERIALAALDGGPIPYLSVMRMKGRVKKFLIIGGNHRVIGLMDIDIDEFVAYVLTSLTAYEQDILIKAVNADHGKTLSADDTIDLALGVARAHPDHKIGDIATDFRISKATLGSAKRAEETRALLASRTKCAAQLTRTHLIKIATLRDEDLMGCVGDLVTQNGLTASETEGICQRLRRGRTAAKRLSELDNVRAEMSTRKDVASKPGRRGVETRLLMAINTLLNIFDSVEGGVSWKKLEVVDEHRRQHCQDKLATICRMALELGVHVDKKVARKHVRRRESA